MGQFSNQNIKGLGSDGPNVAGRIGCQPTDLGNTEALTEV
jgi:hypothetical protein